MEEAKTGVVGAVVGAEVVRAETREGGLVRISELNESPNEARGRTGDLAKRVEEVVLKGSIFFFSTWKAVRTGGFLPPPPPPPVGNAIFLFPPSIVPSPPTHFPNSPALTLVSGSQARTFSARNEATSGPIPGNLAARNPLGSARKDWKGAQVGEGSDQGFLWKS